jgi:hypothetical protein
MWYNEPNYWDDHWIYNQGHPHFPEIEASVPSPMGFIGFYKLKEIKEKIRVKAGSRRYE